MSQPHGSPRHWEFSESQNNPLLMNRIILQHPPIIRTFCDKHGRSGRLPIHSGCSQSDSLHCRLCHHCMDTGFTRPTHFFTRTRRFDHKVLLSSSNLIEMSLLTLTLLKGSHQTSGKTRITGSHGYFSDFRGKLQPSAIRRSIHG